VDEGLFALLPFLTSPLTSRRALVSNYRRKAVKTEGAKNTAKADISFLYLLWRPQTTASGRPDPFSSPKKVLFLLRPRGSNLGVEAISREPA